MFSFLLERSDALAGILEGKNVRTHFQDKSVVQAYRHRPPYPAEVFDILTGLIHEEPRRVLDVGCGTGNIARHLVEHVSWLDAVDVSRPMIEYGKQLPNGNHPHLRWLQGLSKTWSFIRPMRW